MMNIRDFVITKNTRCYINPANDLGLRKGDCIDNLTTLTMKISGKMYVVQLDPDKELGILLPSKDFIYIPADDHPYVNVSNRDYPVFTSENIIGWNKDLVVEEFYIAINNKGEKKVILISRINDADLEYILCTSRFDRNHYTYFVEPVASMLNIEDAKNWKFIPVNEISD